MKNAAHRPDFQVPDIRKLPVDGPVPSPCVNVCRIAQSTGLCEGCYRTIQEIAVWSRATDADKRLIWQAIDRRLQAR